LSRPDLPRVIAVDAHRRCRWWGHGGPLRERARPSARRAIQRSDRAAKEEVGKK
jgi:hypothetical protein